MKNKYKYEHSYVSIDEDIIIGDDIYNIPTNWHSALFRNVGECEILIDKLGTIKEGEYIRVGGSGVDIIDNQAYDIKFIGLGVKKLEIVIERIKRFDYFNRPQQQ